MNKTICQLISYLIPSDNIVHYDLENKYIPLFAAVAQPTWASRQVLNPRLLPSPPVSIYFMILSIPKHFMNKS